MSQMNKYKLLLGVLIANVAGGIGLLTWQRSKPTPPVTTFVSRAVIPPKPVSLVQSITDLYSKGKFKAAEDAAQKYIQKHQHTGDKNLRRAVLEARFLLAFAVARQQKFAQARTLFDNLREAAMAYPEGGAVPPSNGEVHPTMEEQGAYQRSICTLALGDKKAAEKELRVFMRRYPTSILVHGAVKRIARLHGGDVPPEAEKDWQAAVDIQEKAEKKRLREQALCGPQVLAELLKRQGKSADINTLVREMQTDENGTSLLQLQQVAQKHGLTAQGVELRPDALTAQKLPMVALVSPGHFVLVEQVTPDSIHVWEPPATRKGKGERKTHSAFEWAQIWGGYALTL
jgi:tetratricopeptide (TPR) repeat protein